MKALLSLSPSAFGFPQLPLDFRSYSNVNGLIARLFSF